MRTANIGCRTLLVLLAAILVGGCVCRSRTTVVEEKTRRTVETAPVVK